MPARTLRSLSLAAALAILPLSSAVAQEARTPAETSLEAAAEAFEARMEAFGERAEAIAADERLSETERETRIRALWADYAPDVAAFTAAATEHASAIAAEVLADIDVEALVAEALSEVDIEAEVEAALADVDVEAEIEAALADIDVDAEIAEAFSDADVQLDIQAAVEGAVQVATAMATNGAWAQNDPEQAVTYGLIAQYGMDQVLASDEDEDAPETPAPADD